jgi:hypothetical protein
LLNSVSIVVFLGFMLRYYISYAVELLTYIFL